MWWTSRRATEFSRAVNGFRHAVGRPHRRFHAERQIIGVHTGEMDSAKRLDHLGPELSELAGSARYRQAAHGPRIVGPIDNQRLFDVFRAARVIASKLSERFFG